MSYERQVRRRMSEPLRFDESYSRHGRNVPSWNEDGELSRWMHWLMTTHVRRYQGRHRSSGHVWQGRFKAFPIQEDEHLLAVLRYIERNPLRAKFVDRAEDWPWSSLPWLSRLEHAPVKLDPGTAPRGPRWVDGVNESSTDPEVDRVRECIRRDRPFGSPGWTIATARRLGLESSLRARGRPYGTGSDQTSPTVETGPSNSG